MLTDPLACVACKDKMCERAKPPFLGVCSFGITYFHDGQRVHRKELFIPLGHVASNLRHELNPILGIIVQEATEINPRVSMRAFDRADPASRIVAAATIIDHFIEMIMAVAQRFPQVQKEKHDDRSLGNLIDNYFAIYSLLGNRRRAEDLVLESDLGRSVHLTYGVRVIEYLIAILLDNAWKYSKSGTSVKVAFEQAGENLISLSIANVGAQLVEDVDIFELGKKGNRNSTGFGYGLYWARILIRNYNHDRPDPGNITRLQHTVTDVDAQWGIYCFTITNLLAKVSG